MMLKPSRKAMTKLWNGGTLFIFWARLSRNWFACSRLFARQQVFVRAEQKESEYAGVINPLLDVLIDQGQRLSRNSARIASFVRSEALDEEQGTALAGIIQTVIDVVLTLHELLVLLPREAPEPQVFLVLQDCFKDEWKNTSVIMTNALSSYEYRIEDVLDKYLRG